MSLREDVGNIYKSCLSKLDPADTVYSYLKNKLSEVLIEVICPIGKKIKNLLQK